MPHAGPFEDFGRMLQSIYAECRESDWDGYGADPVTLAHLGVATALLSALPERYQHVDAGPQPDGCIALSWDTEDRRVFTISAELDASLPYAGVLRDGRHVHGTVTHDVDGLAQLVALLDESIASVHP